MIASYLNAPAGSRLAHTYQVAGLEDIQGGWQCRAKGETVQLQPEASFTYATGLQSQ